MLENGITVGSLISGGDMDDDRCGGMNKRLQVLAGILGMSFCGNRRTMASAGGICNSMEASRMARPITQANDAA
ncbi:hypothetical protein [Mesorhizobium shangrilense]|uniref:Uncharacterized protein n=1 Tax=Mesorhizobium shangrilense TaxID=460060 RepID=A0ABV2DAI8_9HYPH